MMQAALVLNALVLFPVLALILRDEPGMRTAFGPDSAARRILACVYAAILLASLALLWLLFTDHPEARGWAQPLLAVQVGYKLMTLPALGARHPVVLSNLGIAAFHGAALITG